MLAGAAAACEALVGITDRQLGAQGSDASEGSAATGGDVSSPATDATGEGPSGLDALADGDDASISTSSSSGGGQPDGDAGVSTDTLAPDAADVSTSDAPLRDAGADAPDAAPLDPDLPCSMQPAFVFCEDWDSVATVGQNWSYVYPTPDGGGVAQIQSTYVRSSPHALQIIQPPSSTAIVETQLGKQNLGPLSTSVRVAFDLRPDFATYTNLPQAGIVQVYLSRPTGGNVQINFNLGQGAYANLGAFVADGGSPSITATLPALATWTRIAIAYDSSGSLSLYQDGTLMGTQSCGAGAPGSVNLIVGAVYVNPNGTQTLKLEMDNVVVSGH
jgi:hypothetical protein